MKIFYSLLFVILLINSSSSFLQAAEQINSASSKQKNSIATKSTPLFEDELLRIHYRASSVMPTAMMKMKLTEGPMYYFGKLTITNKTDSEMEVRVNIQDILSKEETSAKVEKLAAKRLNYSSNGLTDTFTLQGAVAQGSLKRLTRQYNQILTNIGNYYNPNSVEKFKLAAGEKYSMEFGLRSYTQKPQIAINYKTNLTEPDRFFFQGIPDIETQKQILTK